jgi:hypothetical protein
MRHLIYVFIVLLTTVSCKTTVKEDIYESSSRDTVIYLKNSESTLGIMAWGGAYVDFRINDSINPYTWSIKSENMPENNKDGAPFAGHFLCLGRWGSPTEGEMKAGVPHNGEATNTWWNIKEKTDKKLIMTNIAPLDGMEVKRTVILHENKPVFHVKEEVKNITKIGRLNNIVQHATIGEPFLDTSTIVNSNAGKGFLQKHSYPNPHKYEYSWPEGIIDSTGTPLNLEETKTSHGYVTTHIYDDEYGWITAYNPKMGKVLGYIWRTDEYKWSNIWHCFVDGKPWAKGLEFGTTGIGRSYQELLAVDTRFHGIPSFEFLDAGEEVEKSFTCFFWDIEKGLEGIDDIKISGDSAFIKLKGTGKSITIPLSHIDR